MNERSRWQEADRLFERALDLPAAQRSAFLDDECQGDEALRRQVERLLEFADSELPDDDVVGQSGALRGPLWDAIEPEIDTAVEQDATYDIGDSIGAYEITGRLGAGGMGIVWRARDPVLDREVAIKALPSRFASHLDLLHRFDREARVLASLHHPNIGAIYGIEVAEGRPFLVLELVEGVTLANLLREGPLSIDRSVQFALQMAEALEEAHSQGVIHRDLKPSNVQITADDRLKVLDFGLAKGLDEEEDLARTSPLNTAEGTILGTATYMSPEQARAQPLDHRTDIWSFGCVVFEMLTGRRVFAGATSSDVLAAVLNDDIPWQALPDDTPLGLRRLLRRALHRSPKERLQNMGDARLELLELPLEQAELALDVERRTHSNTAPWAIAALATLIAIALGFQASRAPPHDPPTSTSPAERLVPMALGEGVTLTPRYPAAFALSPDGNAIVVSVRSQGDTSASDRLIYRQLDQLEWQELPNTQGVWQPFFSPDGSSIGFFDPTGIRRLDLETQTVTTVATIGGNARGGTWLEDDSIVFSPSQTSGLMRVRGEGGRIEPLTELDVAEQERSHRWPQAIPGTNWLLFTVQPEGSTFNEANLELVDVATGERRRLWQRGSHGRYLPARGQRPNRVLFASRGGLHELTLNASFEATGTPRLLLNGLRHDARNGGAQLAVAQNGVIGIVPDAPQTGAGRPMRIDRSGTSLPLYSEAHDLRQPQLSPDGGLLVAVLAGASSWHLWTIDTVNGTRSELVRNERTILRPIFSRDGKSVFFSQAVPNGWEVAAIPTNGTAPPTVLVRGKGVLYAEHHAPLQGSTSAPETTTLLFRDRSASGDWDVYSQPLTISGSDFQPSGEASAVLSTRANEGAAAVSPDGRWLAFESDELDDVVNVYVRPWPGPGLAQQVDSDGSRLPTFTPGGKLFFWRTGPNALLEVDWKSDGDRFEILHKGPVWGPDNPAGQRIAAGDFQGSGTDSFGAHPDNEHFFLLEREQTPEPPAAGQLVLSLP